MSELLTVAAWAKLHDMSRQAGHQAVKRCQIPLSADGRVDRLVADTLYLARTRPRARNVASLTGDQTSAAPNPAASPSESPAGASPAVDPNSPAGSRARKEAADAEMAELEAAKMAGRLVDREAIERGVSEAFRTLRNAAFTAAKDSATMVLGLTELREVQQILEDNMRQAFAQFEATMQHKLQLKSQPPAP